MIHVLFTYHPEGRRVEFTYESVRMRYNVIVDQDGDGIAERMDNGLWLCHEDGVEYTDISFGCGGSP